MFEKVGILLVLFIIEKDPRSRGFTGVLFVVVVF